MANDMVDTNGPLGSPMGQALQKGLGMLFGMPSTRKTGMVAAPKPVTQATPPQPVQQSPNIMPTMDLNSPNNVMKTVDSMVNGK